MNKNIIMALLLLILSCQLSFASIHEVLSSYMISSARVSEPESWIGRCQKETGYSKSACKEAYIYYTDDQGRKKLKVIEELNRFEKSYLINQYR